MTGPLLEIRDLTKAYPGVIANDGVSFEIGGGEIHALLGENGAGKSTLVKMIYGLVQPDSGGMTLHGQDYRPARPSAARAAGVGMVFQHFSLFEALSVAENVSLGMEDPPAMSKLAERITRVSEGFGLPLDPGRLVGDLSAGERQRVEIVRCLLQNPKLLIMDEPTSVLTPQEVEILFDTLDKLAADGTSILYISHKLEEIRTLCDEATILRQGKVVGSANPRESTAAELAELMVGTELTPAARRDAPIGAHRLVVESLNLPSASQFGTSLRNISFSVRAREILGIGGVAGNGQDELLAALSGERVTARGTVVMDGMDMSQKGPAERRLAGLLTAPEERLGHAAAPDMSLTENTLLTAADRMRLADGGFIRHASARVFAEDVIGSFDVRTPGPDVAARALSGGNLQKFVIGREIRQEPEILVVNQPTWGVDAAAAATIRQSIIDLALYGAAVVVISQDLEELLEISDLFAALNGGEMSKPVPTAGLTMAEIGLMLGGAHDMKAVDEAAVEIEDEGTVE